MDPLPFLQEIFPHKSENEIKSLIELTQDDLQQESYERWIEILIDMLSSNDLNGDEINVNVQENDEAGLGEDNHLNIVEEDEEEGAVGGYFQNPTNLVWDLLKQTLPEADPNYLRDQANRFANEPENLDQFVIKALETNNYPTMKDYLKQQREDDVLEMYQPDYDFNLFLEKFMKQFPDPEKHFLNSNRPNPLDDEDVTEHDVLYAKTFLYNKYPEIRKKHLDLMFVIKKRNLFDCCNALDFFPKELKRRREEECFPVSRNLALLQEVAYAKYRKYILMVLKYKNEVFNKIKEEARALGLLESCGVCMDDELIPEECFTCMKGCVFCQSCVQKYVEVQMGDGLTTFPCCNDCDSQFNLYVLQLALPQNIFEKLVLKIQSNELKKANLEGLEMCPFCDFVSVTVEENKTFKCQNDDCLKESCRLCKHESHIPLRCNEIEYDEDVRRRTYIENMMTDALVRTCPNCNKKFVKSNGCNKMTCSCGTKVCYLCSQVINGYDHFSEAGCPLVTNDAVLDLNRVKKNADIAKLKLGNVEIKFDPAQGIEGFFVK
ncbi:uncharacterized protein LOC126735155 [Anthonomus grandis grandis]|uniref:uncharacterized protein LOC126735155 n=1 Tax=Anthonomus grandis grandis TaxID=2921223 RepID=UPI002166085B|nr:uncharacterized protein LOC126735155 [Anthonomus grandis grandis]XP_050295057.1 uncharacterized protein LOC126735155 [Anthonomus grandis grandis]